MIGPLSYIGGKNRLAKKIIALFPEHTTYVEPFAGGAQVFFRKEPSEVEVLNDLDGEIVNFFRICQTHHEELLRYIRFMVVSRKWYHVLQQTPAEVLTDIQRAARMFYLQKNSFGGLIVRPSYATHVTQPPHFERNSVETVIEATHRRLAHVQIEALPCTEILRRYDRPTTLFYLDPPYFGKKLYRFNMKDADFEELAASLKKLTGRFVLSLNDVPEVRRIFSQFKIAHVELAYSAQRKSGNRYAEVIIKNF